MFFNIFLVTIIYAGIASMWFVSLLPFFLVFTSNRVPDYNRAGVWEGFPKEKSLGSSEEPGVLSLS